MKTVYDYEWQHSMVEKGSRETFLADDLSFGAEIGMCLHLFKDTLLESTIVTRCP